MAKDKELRSYQKRYVGETPTSADPTTAAPTVDSSMSTEMPTGRTFGTSKKIRDGDPEPDANDPVPVGVTMDLGKVSPYDRGLVNRVTEPYGGVIDDNTTTGEKMGGFWGGALDLADDFFPDDLGGLIAGDSEQWVRVPYLTDAYKHTLGGGLGYSMELGGAGLNALTWTADQVNAGLAWGMTALPGGPRTMDLEWEPNNWGGLNTVGEGAEISAGAAAAAVYGNLFRNFLGNENGFTTDRGFDDATEKFIDEYAFFASEDFDLYSDEDRKKAFEDQNVGKYLSGVQDAATAVGGDPLFLLSKPFKVFAFGGRIGNKPIGGYLNQNLETKVARNSFIEDMEKGLDLHFAEGNNSTASFREIIEFVDASPRDLSRAKKGNILIKNTDNPGAMKSIKQALSEDRDEALAEMVSVVKILLQDETGLLTLQGGKNPRLLDVVARELNDGVSYFQATRPIDDFGLKLGNDLIADARSILDDMYPVEARPQSPFIPKPEAPKSLVGGATLRSGGTRSDTAAKLKVTARQGFAESDARPTRRQKQLDPEAARLREATVESYESQGFIWNVVKATAASRPIALVRWGNKGLPVGVVHLKGGDGVNSDLEYANWLRETEITPAMQDEFLARWANSGMSPADKRNILIESEKAAISAIGKRLGKDYSEVMDIYKAYDVARAKALSDQLDPTQGGKGFSVAEDNETLIKAADMYSVLDEQFPMLDVREFRNVVSNIGDMGTIIGVAKNTGAKAADILNNGWKVSVLLRLGYTARNLTEGTLRSVATVGFMATNPKFLARIPASVTYQAYKAYYGRGAKAQASAVQNAMKQNAEALDALKMFGEEDKLSDIARLEEALLEEQAKLARLIEADDAAIATGSDPSNIPVMEPAIALKPANGPIEIGPTKSEIRLKELEERIVSLETDKSFLVAQNRKNLNETGKRTPGYNKTLKSIEDKLKTAKAGKKKLTSYGEDGRSVVVREQMAARAKIAAQRARDYKAEKKLVEGYNKDARKVYEKNIEDIKTEIINRNKGIDEAVVGVDEAQMKLDDAQSLFDDELPKLENLKATRALLAQKLIDEAEMLKKILAQIEGKGDWKYFGRQKIGTGGNVVGRDENGNDIVWDAAFDGADGQMARILSSADSTYQEVFKTGFLSKMNRDRKLGDYSAMDPYKIGDGPNSTKMWNQYWNNYLDRINRRYKQDKIVSGWLTYGDDERDMVAKATEWVMGGSQKNYRSNFGLNDANGKADPTKVREHIDMMHKNYSKELPIGSGLRQTLNSSSKGVTKEQLLSSLGDSELPVIPVLREGKEYTGLFKYATRKDNGQIRPGATIGGAVGSVVGGAMKVLGSIPETKLLRHPYYAAVYRKEQLRMANMAKADGKSIGDARIRDRINATAHRYALQQTRKTLYTIERQTSGSQALRFLFPFFPAWSNTLRTWSGIAYQNPAIVAYANAMWNIPNSLGWVVDGDGNKVEFSNMFSSDEDTFIVQPENMLKATLALRKIPVAGYLASKTPILNTMIPVMDEDGNAIPVATRQSGLNVVFTGGIMDPGVGPLTPIATGLILRGKPELTEVLRKSMGDDMFRRIVANGDPNTPIKDIILPTFVKRASAKMFAGENENTAFLRLQNTMTQDAIITAAAAGKVLTQEDFEKVIRNADALWSWTVDQSLTAFTASTSYRSPYTVERKIWRDLLDNTSLVYSKKIEKFMDKMGELHPDQDPMTYFGLTGSTSESAFKVNSNQQSYDRLTKNPKIVEDIADDLGKEFVGQFTGIGDQSEPFSYSVYGELQNHSIGNDLVKEKMTADELFKKDQISKGWQEFFLAVDDFDDQAKSVGLESYKDLGDDVIDAVEDYKQSLGEKYPAYGDVIRIDYDISTTSKRLEVARITVESASVEDRRRIPTIGVLEEYLQGRDAIISLLDDVDGLDMQVTKKAELKKEIRKQGYLFAGTLRNKDISFSEYYDRYFSNDKF